MTYVVSITSQGQISIPVDIQRQLGLSKKQQAIVSIENGKMVVEPVKDLLELEGSLKTNKKPLALELPFSFVLKNGVKVFGKIDRVDKKGTGIEIID